MSEESESDDKTEDASLYRLEKAREKGDVAISKEIGSIMVLAGCFFTFILSSYYMFEEMTHFIENMSKLNITNLYSKNGIQEFLELSVFTMLKISFPIFLVSLVLGICAPLFQIGFIFSPELISANLNRLNPLEGVKRIFSKKSVFEFVKGIIKFIFVGVVTYFSTLKMLQFLNGFFYTDIPSLLKVSSGLMISLMFSIFLGLAILALADFAFEKFTYMQKMRMSKREVKEELKEREGNPEIRSKIKSIQRELAKKRMMKELPNADVIVTNPTHLSVALKYDKNKMIAPLVVAKGADHLALKIREIAKNHEIPIVENITIARALYQNVRVGEAVPRNYYQAVAEILGFVYRLKKKKKSLGVEAVNY